MRQTVIVPGRTLTDGCLCGAIHFELAVSPYTAGYCHCTRCQRERFAEGRHYR